MTRAFAATAIALVACGAASKIEREAAFYQAELMECVRSSDTLQESKDCRARVMRHHGRDAGGTEP